MSVKVNVKLHMGIGGTTAAATGTLREAIGFVLTSFEKQLENEGGLAAIAELMQQGKAIEYALTIWPESSSDGAPK